MVSRASVLPLLLGELPPAAQTACGPLVRCLTALPRPHAAHRPRRSPGPYLPPEVPPPTTPQPANTTAYHHSNK